MGVKVMRYRGNLGGTRWGWQQDFSGTRNRFEKGNKEALASNMSEESNRRRLKALMRAWATSERKRRGEKVMTAKEKGKIMKRQRERLRENLQAEARDIQNMARCFAKESMERLFEIAREPMKEDSVAIAAIALILERAYGKATQTSVTALMDANGKSTQASSKELDERIAETLRTIEKLTGGTAQPDQGEERPADIRLGDRNPDDTTIH